MLQFVSTLFFLSLMLLPICRSSNDFFCKHEIGSRHHDDHLDEGNLIEAFAAVINRSDTSLIGPVDAVTPITYLKIRMVVNKISMLLVLIKSNHIYMFLKQGVDFFCFVSVIHYLP